MTLNLADIANITAEADVPDMTKPSEGKSTTLAPGMCGLRLIGYIELGDFNGEYMGKPKTESRTQLLFEVTGKKYPPVDGVAQRITLRLNCNSKQAPNAKSNAFKVFSSMNYTGAKRSFLDMLGDTFKGTIIINDKGFANLDRVITKPVFEEIDPETGSGTGKFVDMKIPEATNPYRVFVFSRPSKATWDSLFIDGFYPAGEDSLGNHRPEKSKNIYQETIKSADNFKGSGVERMLLGDFGLPKATTVPSMGDKAPVGQS